MSSNYVDTESSMRAVIQRVIEASVTIDGESVAKVGKGVMILLGIEEADDLEDSSWLAKKIVQMRIFEDEEGKMNKSLLDCKGEVLVVSQFTLHASTKKGNRPSFMKAAKPDISEPLYEQFMQDIENLTERSCARGKFGADMKVGLINDGPVTIVMDTKDKE